MLRTSATFALLVLAVSCGPKKPGPGDDDGDDAGNGGPHVLDAIAITPLNQIVQLDLNATGTQAYMVTGEYEDGTTDDLTAMATWTVDNPAVGTMTGATLNIPAFAAVSANVSKIHASVTTSDGTFTSLAQITVVAYRQTGTQTDFFFTLPYLNPASTQTKPLTFSTTIPALDAFFLMDTTGSMSGEINNLKSGVSTIATTIQASTPDAEFGVAQFKDFPVSPFSGPPDQPFILGHAITSDVSAVTSAMTSFTATGGGDTPEAGYEAAYQGATGPEGLTGPGTSFVGSASVDPAYAVDFRTGTMPILVGISDAPSHAQGLAGADSCGENYDYSTYVPDSHSADQTVAALNNICAHYVGIAAIGAGCGDATQYMGNLSTQTNSLVPPGAWDYGTRPSGCPETECCTGQGGAGIAPVGGLCPLVFQVDTSGNGVSTSIATGIEMLTRFATFDVPTSTSGVTTDITGTDMLPSPHTTADFIKSIPPVPGTAGYTLPPPPPNIPAPTIDANGIQFDGVTPGTQVVFNVNAANDFVMQTDQAQIFEATISVTSGGCQVLDQRTVLILVPPNDVVIQ